MMIQHPRQYAISKLPEEFRMPAARALLAFAVALTLPGCDVIGTIFEVGVWVGVVAVVAVLALIAFVISRFRR